MFGFRSSSRRAYASMSNDNDDAPKEDVSFYCDEEETDNDDDDDAERRGNDDNCRSPPPSLLQLNKSSSGNKRGGGVCRGVDDDDVEQPSPSRSASKSSYVMLQKKQATPLQPSHNSHSLFVKSTPPTASTLSSRSSSGGVGGSGFESYDGSSVIMGHFGEQLDNEMDTSLTTNSISSCSPERKEEEARVRHSDRIAFAAAATAQMTPPHHHYHHHEEVEEETPRQLFQGNLCKQRTQPLSPLSPATPANNNNEQRKSVPLIEKSNSSGSGDNNDNHDQRTAVSSLSTTTSSSSSAVRRQQQQKRLASDQSYDYAAVLSANGGGYGSNSTSEAEKTDDDEDNNSNNNTSLHRNATAKVAVTLTDPLLLQDEEEYVEFLDRDTDDSRSSSSSDSVHGNNNNNYNNNLNPRSNRPAAAAKSMKTPPPSNKRLEAVVQPQSVGGSSSSSSNSSNNNNNRRCGGGGGVFRELSFPNNGIGSNHTSPSTITTGTSISQSSSATISPFSSTATTSTTTERSLVSSSSSSSRVHAESAPKVMSSTLSSPSTTSQRQGSLASSEDDVDSPPRNQRTYLPRSMDRSTAAGNKRRVDDAAAASRGSKKTLLTTTAMSDTEKDLRTLRVTASQETCETLDSVVGLPLLVQQHNQQQKVAAAAAAAATTGSTYVSQTDSNNRTPIAKKDSLLTSGNSTIVDLDDTMDSEEESLVMSVDTELLDKELDHMATAGAIGMLGLGSSSSTPCARPTAAATANNDTARRRTASVSSSPAAGSSFSGSASASAASASAMSLSASDGSTSTRQTNNMTAKQHNNVPGCFDLATAIDEESEIDDSGLLSFALEEEDDVVDKKSDHRFFSDPNKRLLDSDASFIPGSPFSKPANMESNRPTEPLGYATFASSAALVLTLAWVAFLFYVAITCYDSPGRIAVECILALISFSGLFSNSYWIVSSVLKCFIPNAALQTNTKYCSIISETKPTLVNWPSVTIQVPIYQESLIEVIMPTLKSCIAAREHYRRNSVGGGPAPQCNIVVCDDGIMSLLRDNFSVAEMLWESIQRTEGRVIKLRQLLAGVPRASRRHLKGLRSKSVFEVFHRMLFYYHYNIGFVARSTLNRQGRVPKASNLNSHLRLALGAAQIAENKDGKENLTFEQALLRESHNDDGSRFIMFGNDIKLGELICINDAEGRMAEAVILKTAPEFINDKTLGFTQHTTKTLNEQRSESYFTNMLAVFTDMQYQCQFLLSSVLGCHPPLVGHSIFLRTAAVQQVGRMRMMKTAKRWLKNIGLPMLAVDQLGMGNLQAENKIEYWSESHVSEGFELMIHLYNLGFNGRYCAYPQCEFQHSISRGFDDEAKRYRKLAMGAVQLVFNPFLEWCGHGVFTPPFKTFMKCDIPAYYKIFLMAYLCIYTMGGTYIIVFAVAAVARIVDNTNAAEGKNNDGLQSWLILFSPAVAIILNYILYFVVGFACQLVLLIRIHYANSKLLFPEYQKKWLGPLYLFFALFRSFMFQVLSFSVATFSLLGRMDHILSRSSLWLVSKKITTSTSRCYAFGGMLRSNFESWVVALLLACLAYSVFLRDSKWDVTAYPKNTEGIINLAVFVGPVILLALMSLFNPLFFNPYILGWPFVRKSRLQNCKKTEEKSSAGDRIMPLNAFIDKGKQLSAANERVDSKPDVELDSLPTKEMRARARACENDTTLLVDTLADNMNPTDNMNPRPSQPCRESRRPLSIRGSGSGSYLPLQLQ